MQTVTLKISDKIYEKLMWLLSKFGKDELEIVSDNTAFLKTQKYLQSELKEIKNGDTVFHEIDELDKRLETIIRKNETII